MHVGHRDQKARNHVSDLRPGTRGNQIEAHEFDYTVHDQLVYEDAASNFSVYSNPAFHYDTPGPVSLRLEWNGLSVTYSGRSKELSITIKYYTCMQSMGAIMLVVLMLTHSYPFSFKFPALTEGPLNIGIWCLLIACRIFINVIDCYMLHVTAAHIMAAAVLCIATYHVQC